MKKFLRKPALFSIAFVLFFLLASMGTNAQVTSTATGGLWSATTTWVGGVVPTAGQNVVIATTGGNNVDIQTTINQTGSVTVNSGAILTSTANGPHTIGSLIINSGGTVNMNRGLTVSGTTSISGTINFASTSGTARPMVFTGDVTLNSGAVWTEAANNSNGDNNTYSFGGNFANNATTFTATNNAAAIHTFTGAGKTISGSTTTSIPFVTISGSYTNSGTLTVGNTLTINGGASLTNNGTVNASATLTIAGSMTNNATTTVTTSLAGAGSLTNSATGTLNINSAITLTTLTATAAGNTVNYTGAGQTLKVTGYSKLGLSGSGNKTFGAGLTMGSNLSISGSAVASLGNNNFTVPTLTINGTGQAAGTYGSTASAATFKPSAFGTTGTGILTVSTQTCTPPTINGTLSVCGGLTTQLSSPDAPAASNPWVSATTSVATISNTGLATGVSSGTSVITFTNSTGCVNTATLTVNATPSTDFTKTDVQCFNTNTGSITIIASGGSAPYTYSIDNGASYPNSSGTFNNLGIGTYKIRVKDANQCQSKSVQ
jgi:hypothetical protein